MVLLQISWRKGFEDSRNPPVDDAALSKIPLCRRSRLRGGAGRCGEVYPPLEGGQVRHSASADKP